MLSFPKSVPASTLLTLFSILFLLTSGFLSACATSKAERISQANKKFEKAIESGAMNRKSEMYAQLKEAAELNPEEPRYHLTLALAYYNDGDLKNAEKEFLQTIAVDENYSEAYRRLGRLYMQQGEWEKAIHFLNEGIRRPGVASPQEAYNWLGFCYYQQGDFDKAEAQWLKAVSIKPNPAIYLNLGMAYKDQGRYEEARDSLIKAISLDAKLIRAYHHLALLYLKEKNLRMAKKHFETVIELRPQSELARSSREYLQLIKSRK